MEKPTDNERFSRLERQNRILPLGQQSHADVMAEKLAQRMDLLRNLSTRKG